MKTKPYNVNASNIRTLESLKVNLEKYNNEMQADPKFAKECNNVIDDVFFDIDLSRVSNED